MEDKNELLNDLLQEAAPADFRAALLAQTLGRVRHRQNAKRRNRMFLSVALVVAVSIALWNARSPEAIPLIVKAPALVDPLVIIPKPFSPEDIITINPESVENVRTSLGSVTMIKTASEEILFKKIDDDELLTLLAGRPAVLIRQSPGQAELHFSDPEDSTELFLP